VDASQVVGLTEVNSDRSTGTLTVTNLAAGATLGLKGNGVAALGNVTGSYVAAATAANIVVDGGTGAASAGVTVLDGAGLTSATITGKGGVNALTGVAFGTGTGTADNVKAVTIDAQSNLTTGNITGLAAASTITVKGAGTANIGTLQATNVTSVDASANTGGVTATLNDVTTLKFVGGAGNDVLTTGAVLATGASVDAGAGTADRLVVANTAHITAAAGKFYKGFEQLQVEDGVSVDVSQLASTNTIDTVVINQGANATGVTNLSAAQAAAVTVKGTGAGVITFGVKDATVVGNIDTLKVIVDDGAVAKANVTLTAPVMSGVENLELTANENVTITALTSATGLTSAKFAGAGNLDVTTGAVDFALNSTFDFSAATGTVRLDASDAQATATGGLSIKGSLTAANTILDSAKADVITGGAKADTVTFTGGADTVTLGGAGDTFDFNNVKGNAANGLTFKFAAGDSAVKSGATGAFAAASAFDATVTDTITGFDAAALDVGAGAKFTIDTDVTAISKNFGTALTFGTTAVDQAGGFFILDNSANETNTAYVFQDSNGNGKIDATDFMIKLVGTAQLADAEFAVSSGNLVFTSA
jgi:hypothetical protein